METTAQESFFTKILNFIKKNTVMIIAFSAAVITGIFVPVDKEYLGHFDFKTLTCLFCVFAVVCALKNRILYRHVLCVQS